jgi:hypothetical protein
MVSMAIVAAMVGCSDGGDSEVSSGAESSEAAGDPAQRVVEVGDLEGTDTMFGRVDGGDLVPFSTASEDYHATLGLLDVTSGEVSDLPSLPGDPIAAVVYTSTDGVHVVAGFQPCSPGVEVVYEGSDSGPYCDETTSNPTEFHVLRIGEDRWRPIAGQWDWTATVNVKEVDSDRLVLGGDQLLAVDLTPDALEATPWTPPQRGGRACSSQDVDPVRFDSFDHPTVAWIPDASGGGTTEVVLPTVVADRLAAVVRAGRPCATDGTVLALTGDEPPIDLPELDDIPRGEPATDGAGAGGDDTIPKPPKVGADTDIVVDLADPDLTVIDAGPSGYHVQPHQMTGGWWALNRESEIVFGNPAGIETHSREALGQLVFTDSAVLLATSDFEHDRGRLRPITIITP